MSVCVCKCAGVCVHVRVCALRMRACVRVCMQAISAVMTNLSAPTSPNNADGTGLFWDDPRKVGMEVAGPDGSSYFRGPGQGTPVYLTHLRARSRDFIKGGDAIFLLSMEGKPWILRHHCVQAVPQTVGSGRYFRAFVIG